VDETVIAAIAKWPNVPAVFGWIGLTSRGEWRLQGEPIANRGICDFIGRNYAGDERGRWFFQNGPQRVFVELEVAPWIWRLGPTAGVPIRTHTGRAAGGLRGAWLDESGRLFLHTDIGFGLVDSADSARAVESLRGDGLHALAIDDLDVWLAGLGPDIRLLGCELGLEGEVTLGRLRAADMPQRFGYVRVPQPE
jgi:hypothetical protein